MGHVSFFKNVDIVPRGRREPVRRLMMEEKSCPKVKTKLNAKQKTRPPWESQDSRGVIEVDIEEVFKVCLWGPYIIGDRSYYENHKEHLKLLGPKGLSILRKGRFGLTAEMHR